MPNVIAIIKDPRVRRQVEQYLDELELEDVRHASFASVQEFQEIYFREAPAEPAPDAPTESSQEASPEAPPKNSDAPAPESEGAELKLFSEIHFVIFALDTINERSGPWIDKLKLNLFKFKHWPKDSRPRLIMLKYEDDGVTKLEVLHPLLDDLIYLPLDRLVFLQKMDIFVSLPKRTKSRFLFTQEVKQSIEISKITKVDRFSDVGLAIRNPVPLRRGLPGHFYLQLPGEKARLELKGKVFRSEPHPDYPGQHLVYFTYFALGKGSLTAIRKTLSKSPRYQSLLNEQRENFMAGDLFFQSEDITGVAVLDPDDLAAHSLAQTVAKEIEGVRTVAESSFQLFLHRYFEKQEPKNTTPPDITEEKDFFRVPLSLMVSTENLECMSVDPGPTEEDKFLSHSALHIFSDPKTWLNLFDDKEAKIVLGEAVALAKKGRVLERCLPMRDGEGKPRAVRFKIYNSESEHLVNVELGPAGFSDVQRTIEEKVADTKPKLDALVMDTGFVPDETASWIQGLRERAVQLELSKANEPLKFFLMSENENLPKSDWFESTDILGLVVKPVDVRHLLFLLSEGLGNKATLYNFENLGWTSPSLTVHVSKGVDLEAVSEFGATLKSKQRLAPGTMIYLRKFIYNNAPNECLAARVYACEEHPSEKGQYQVMATYFGINDAFLKFARTWIRENYAQQKSQAESGG